MTPYNTLAVLLISVVLAAIIGLSIGRESHSLAFTREQCNTLPTGRVHRDVRAVIAEEGKPVGVVERVTAIEYATACEKMEWRTP